MVEDPLPDAGTLMMLCGEMVPAQRPLKPTRVERKKVLMQDITGKDIKILLSVVRAYDVPIRSDQDPMAQPTATTISGVSQFRDGPQESSVYRSSSRHVFTNFPNTNLGIFSTKYYVIFVLIFSNAQN